ncbi:MAG: icmV [Gammaproteobacteria bacterium]|nr:icmV [Gammaproteobacteria bacterium]
MKKIFRALGRPFKPFVNIPTFLGWKELKSSYQNLSGMTKAAITPVQKEAAVQESFEEAKARLGLSEQDLINKRKEFLKMSVFYLVMAVGLFIYLIYLLFTGVFLGVFVAAVLVFVALAFAYREHFWYVQMSQRTLGLTFKDWRNYTFSRGNK